MGQVPMWIYMSLVPVRDGVSKILVKISMGQVPLGNYVSHVLVRDFMWQEDTGPRCLCHHSSDKNVQFCETTEGINLYL